jgi:hypothetical protein
MLKEVRRHMVDLEKEFFKEEEYTDLDADSDEEAGD